MFELQNLRQDAKISQKINRDKGLKLEGKFLDMNYGLSRDSVKISVQISSQAGPQLK